MHAAYGHKQSYPARDNNPEERGKAHAPLLFSGVAPLPTQRKRCSLVDAGIYSRAAYGRELAICLYLPPWGRGPQTPHQGKT